MTAPPIDKIAKLLRLAEGAGTTPSEAANAATQAQRLMDRYKLSREVIDEHDKPEPIERAEQPLFVGRRMVSWRRVLAGVIARTSDCRLLLVTKSNGQRRLELVGRQSNVAVAHYLYAYVGSEIERLSKLALRERHFPHRGQSRTWANNFRLAAAVQIGERLRQARMESCQEAKSSSHGTAALVLLRQHGAELDRFVERVSSGAAPPIAPARGDKEAQRAGRVAADGIALRRAVGEGGQSPELEATT